MNDGTHESASAYTMTVNVTANNAPAFADATLTRAVAENSVADVNVGAVIPEATDADGDTLAYSMEGTDAASFNFDVSSRQITTRSGVTYDHEATKNSYSVTIKADDSMGGTDTVAVTINVTDVNEPPSASDGSVTTRANRAYAFGAGDFNFDDQDAGAALSKVKIATLPTEGALALNGTAVTEDQEVGKSDIDGGNLIFTPATDASGSPYATFTFRVNDGTHESASAYTMTVNVTPNTAPDFADFKLERRVAENSEADVNVGAVIPAATDADGDDLSYSMEGTDVASFNFVESTRQITTKSGVTYDHEDKSSYIVTIKVDDGMGHDDTVVVLIDITDVNEPPTASDGSVTTRTSTAYAFHSGDFNFEDVDNGGTLEKVKIAMLPTAGALALGGTAVMANQEVGLFDLNNGELTFTPVTDATGSPYATFTFRVNDGTNESASAYTMTVNVTPNNAPAFADATLMRAVAENSVADVNVGVAIPAATDADGDTLAYSMEGTDAASFNFNVSSRQITTKTGVTYDHEGKSAYSVRIKAEDDNGGEGRVEVIIGITDVEELPVAPAAPSVSATAGSATSLDVSWAAPSNTGKPDIDSYDLQFRVGDTGDFTAGPQDEEGTSAKIADLTADTEYQVQVRATNEDGDGGWSDSGTGSTSVLVVNKAPTASDSSVTTDEDRAHTFAAGEFSFSDTDSGDTLSLVEVVTLPSDGTLTLDGTDVTVNQDVTESDIDADKLVFTPAANANGTGYASFTFKVSDGTDKSASAYTMTVNVTAVNDAATGAPTIAGTARVGETLTASTAGIADVDGLPDSFSYQWVRVVSGTDADIAGATAGAYTLVAADQGNTVKVKVGFTDDDGTAEELTSAETATIGAVLPTLALNVGDIAADDTVNIAEKAAGFAIAGDTGSEGGVAVTVTVGTTELTATSADADPAAWSVSVPAAASYIVGTSVDVEVNASKTGFTSPGAVARTLAVDLVAPTAPTYTAPASLKVGVAIADMSPAGGSDIDEYSAAGLPPGLSIDAGTGAIGGTPDSADADTATATVTATDTAGNTATVDIAFPAVEKGDQTLAGFQYSASSVTFGSAAPTVTAPTGVLTTLSYTATPATACTVDAVTGALTLVGAGSCVVTATAASTDDYNSVSATFTVTVHSAGNLVLNVGDIAGDDTINIAEKASGFAIAGDTGSEAGVAVTVTVGTTELTATSSTADPATWSVSVPADASYIVGTSVDVEVNALKTGFTSPAAVERALAVDLIAPTAPAYTAPASLQVEVAITDMSPAGGSDVDEYSAAGLPSGLSIDSSTGVIGGTPDSADADTAAATVTATDTAGNTATVDIAFPAVEKGVQTLTGFQYSASSVAFGSAAPTVTAPTGVLTTLSYAAAPATVCTVDAGTGALTLVGAGSCVVTATAASTDDYNEATATFTVTVQSAGNLVLNVGDIAADDTINIAEKAAGFAIAGDTGSEGGVAVTVTVGTAELTATSVDADPATWSVSVPAAASYIAGTSVDVEVNAAKTGYTSPAAVERALAVDLIAPTAPAYTAPTSLQVGAAITDMSPTGGSDVDEYSAAGLPSGLGIDSSTGVIGGTPDSADADTATATVTASDTAGNTATVDIGFPVVDKGVQTLTGFQYSASSVTFGSAAPTVTAPTGALTTLSYAATPATVCTVDAGTGALRLVGPGSCAVTATAASADDYNEATATFTVTVQSAGNLVLNVGDIAADDTINIAEKAAGFAIAGDTGSEGGVAVTVTVGTTELTATSADANPATWSVSVPADASYIVGTSVDVEVNAAKTGFTSPAAVERALAVDLIAPTAPAYTAPASLQVGAAIADMSPAGGSGIDEYSAAGLPSGLRIDSSTGVIGGTPDSADADTATATVAATDTAGNTATVDIAFPAVDKGVQTLTGFQYSASSVLFRSAAPTVTAPTGVLTTLSYAATPATVCTVDPSTGALTIIGVGGCEITATAASTDDYNEATATFTVTVQSAGNLVLNVGAVAGDNTINIAEKAAGFAIAGDTGSEGGVTVTVTVGTADLTATSSTANPATWSVSVPADASYITGTSVDVEVNASKTGFTSPAAVERPLTVDLVAPTAPAYTAPASLQVGAAIADMSPTGGSGIDEYSATGLPSGLSIDAGTGVIGGTPDTADADTATATVTATDTAGNTTTVDIAFPAVDKGVQTLTGFQYSASSVAFGSAAPTVTAPTGVLTTLSYAATPATVCTVDAGTGALTLVGAGSCVVTATAASTDDYNEATATFTVTVQSAGNLVLNVGDIAADDTINIAEKAAGFAIAGDTGSEGGVAVTVTVGTAELTATSADADPATWSVDVPADASYITGTSVDVEVNAAKTGFTSPAAVERALAVDLIAPTAPAYTAPSSLQVGAAITDMSPAGGSDIEEYSATGLPSGLSIDSSTGAIGGTPDSADADTATATVTATDTAGNTVAVDIAFPAVDKGDQTLTGFQYSASSVTFGSAAPTVTAPSGVLTTLSYTATPATVCTVDAGTGALTLVGAGSCVVTATAASTDDYNEATAAFTVTIQPTGTLVLNVGAIAGDDTINIVEKAAGFAIAGDTGSEGGVAVTVTVGTTELTATSAAADPATWSVSVPADASYITGTSVDVEVNASKTGFTSPAAVERALAVDLIAPTAPAYTAPASLQVGAAIADMSPTGGSGIDEYSATGLPSGLSIDAGTGVIGGTPDTADADTATATVTATDTAGNTTTVDIAFPAVEKGDQTLTGFQYSASSVLFRSAAPTVTAPTGVLTTLSYAATPATVCTVDAGTGALTIMVGAGSLRRHRDGGLHRRLQRGHARRSPSRCKARATWC